MARPPIFYHDKGPIVEGGTTEPRGWYFWDRNNEYCGPYDTSRIAQCMKQEYDTL
jgi:hypothetical protein